jgi:BCD family chlorophyll transporter-like MFS transporter
MRRPGIGLIHRWASLGPQWLPFADAATSELPLPRLLRLSLFQISVGMATGLLVGTLNRVMIVEFHVQASLVALMVSLPLVFAPFRALMGFKSDIHRSAFGWKRVPYIWFGSFLQFAGLSIMPFALLLLTGDHNGPAWIGSASAAIAFLLVGAGMQLVQTAGLALAADLAPERVRPRVVALMYTMLMVGMVGFGSLFGALLTGFTPTRLVQVVQGAAVLTVLLNFAAAWKQEPRTASTKRRTTPQPDFRATWRRFARTGRTLRFMVAVGLGTAAFTMQDIILEPYGGEILKLSVSATTALTALMAFGALVGFVVGARSIGRGTDPNRLAAMGALVGLVAFSAVIFAEPLHSPWLFRLGALLIGLGGGLFSHGTLTYAMGLDHRGLNGLALGAWGAVQATVAGVGIALGGAIRDLVTTLATGGWLGDGLSSAATGYSFVYHLELYLMFATLIALGPLVRSGRPAGTAPAAAGLAALLPLDRRRPEASLRGD